MPRLPVVSGREAVHVFNKVGWQISRQEGSHIILTKSGNPVVLAVPDHREVRRGTLRSLIRQAGLTVEEFKSLLKD
ncbi:MAG: type II toxin-antitoxin system HicA family toxin [Chloroflexi bacterium]|nr:type II toxin-antitoxin system HicA family toxin [Chloroflexota bacterium]MBM4451401.1 type II toxin-antitoxin system HicA family toxin [Chloroflexota bacterium]